MLNLAGSFDLLNESNLFLYQGILFSFCTSYPSSLHMFISFLSHYFSFGMEKV